MLILVLGVISFSVAGVYGHAGLMNPKSPPTRWGGPMAQVLTHGHATHATNPFYSADCHILYYVDREDNTLHRKSLHSGKADEKLIDAPGTEGEALAFVYPIKGSEDAVVGAGNYIFTAKYNKDDGSVKYSPPIPIGKDGYYISKAHADKSGTLFLSLNSRADTFRRGGKLFRINNHMPKLVKAFSEVIGDFAWTPDYNNFFLVGDYGRRIYKYDYDKTKKDIKNGQKIYKVPDGFDPSKNVISGIDIDTDGYLWVTQVDLGHVLKINPNTGKVESLIELLVKDPTGLTFGGLTNNALIVTTWRKCISSGRMSGEAFHISGLNSTGVPDCPVEW